MPPPDRRSTDTPASYMAFCDYCAMGSAGGRRSLRELAERYTAQSASGALADRPPTTSVKTLFGWSKRGDWDERSAAWDRQQQADEDAARQAIRAARRAELEEMDWQQGGLLRQRIAEIAAELPRFIRRTVQRIEQDGKVTEVITLALQAGPGELARALKLASELQRLSVGEPTEIHKLLESELGAILDRLQSQLTPEEYARVVAVIAGETAT